MLVLALAMATGATGCIVDVTFDPVGTDATVEGSWLVNGAVPTQASCDSLGIDRVRVRFFDGGTSFDHSSLVFPCADGGFDTTPNPVLADGVWTMQLLAINSSGGVIAMGPRETYDTIVEGGHIVMSTVDFEGTPAQTAITVSWTIDGAAPTTATCGALGIDRVGIDFMDDGEPEVADCESGALTVITPAGSYNVQVHAFNTAGDSVAMGVAESFTLNEGETRALNAGAPVDFVGAGFNPRGTDASLEVTWTVGGTVIDETPDSAVGWPGVTVCNAAAGTDADVEVVLYDADDTAFENGVIVAMAPCKDGGFPEMSNILAAGEYLVSLVLVDDTGAELGRSVAGQVEVMADQILTVDDLTDFSDIRLASTTISFQLGWDASDTIATVDYTTCDDAGVSGVEWALFSGDTMISESTSTACIDDLTFDSGITPGDYELDIAGYSTSAALKEWERMAGSACPITAVLTGDLAIGKCDLDYTP